MIRPKSSSLDSLQLLVRFVYYLVRLPLYVLYVWNSILFTKVLLFSQLKKLKKQKFDLIGQSFMVSSQFGQNGNDFYFGDFQRKMDSLGLKTLFFYVNFSQHNFYQFPLFLIKNRFENRLPEWALLNSLDPIRLSLKQLQSFFKLIPLWFRIRNRLLGDIFLNLLIHVLSHQTHKSGLLFWETQNAVRTWKPKGVITTYEGHSFEKCAWWGSKSTDPWCKTVGFQHTVLFKESLSLLEPFSSFPHCSQPDIVLSIGETPIELMKRNDIHENVKYIPFGSYRYRSEKQALSVSDLSKKTILVTPEGLSKEMVILFTFAYECAKRNPNLRFILRCHPILPFDSILERLPRGIRAQPNILVSQEKDIRKDFEKSSILLNRRSSTGLYAVLNGLRLIYLSRKGRIESDPLFKMKSWRRECQTVEDFDRIIREFEKEENSDQHTHWQEAVQFVSRYTRPVTEESYQQIVQAIGEV